MIKNNNKLQMQISQLFKMDFVQEFDKLEIVYLILVYTVQHVLTQLLNTISQQKQQRQQQQIQQQFQSGDWRGNFCPQYQNQYTNKGTTQQVNLVSKFSYQVCVYSLYKSNKFLVIQIQTILQQAKQNTQHRQKRNSLASTYFNQYQSPISTSKIIILCIIQYILSISTYSETVVIQSSNKCSYLIYCKYCQCQQLGQQASQNQQLKK
eukprot:TRINITY_DN6493_c0_g4_i1.p1 TRINITY_DN6493_c0_g4~~TRINITY_DN6493_c0_g4_i1.p1  ORF type:complete len:208 (-),score=-15.63 TRINITY_DN6493_c0_g4_i1:261-884(-)